MLNPISFDSTLKSFSLTRAIKKLPWLIFAMVLVLHLGVLWWLLGGYFDQTSDVLPEPIFVTLEAVEALPSEILLLSETDETTQANLHANR
jgi:ABC-type nitrate/sulfonate/bicarbonate transport system permease component